MIEQMTRLFATVLVADILTGGGGSGTVCQIDRYDPKLIHVYSTSKTYSVICESAPNCTCPPDGVPHSIRELWQSPPPSEGMK